MSKDILETSLIDEDDAADFFEMKDKDEEYGFTGEVIEEDRVVSTSETVNMGDEEETIGVIPEVEIPEEFTPWKNDENDPDRNSLASKATLSSTMVAERLGINHRNVILNYTNAFYDYLAVYRNLINNRFYYTEEAVKQLAFIINDRANNRRTIKQELDFIQSSYGGKAMNMVSNNLDTMEAVLNQMQNNIITAVTQLNEQSERRLLQHIQQTESMRIEQKDKEAAALSHLEKRYEEKYAEQEQEYKKQLYEKAQEIERLEEKIKEQEELLSHKKKGFFFRR